MFRILFIVHICIIQYPFLIKELHFNKNFTTFFIKLPMVALTKKSKKEKLEDLKKMEEAIEKYDTVVFVENTDIQNTCFQNLRALIDGKVFIVKKALFQRAFLNVNFKENYFVIFTNSKELEKINSFEYKGFLKSADISPKTIIMKAGVIKSKKLEELVCPVERKGANTILLEDYVVCEEGDTIDENQANILCIRGDRISNRKLNIIKVDLSKNIVKATK